MTMKPEEQPGTISVAALNARPSVSADQARLSQIQADLALSARERMMKALELGLGDGSSDVLSKRKAP